MVAAAWPEGRWQGRRQHGQSTAPAWRRRCGRSAGGDVPRGLRLRRQRLALVAAVTVPSLYVNSESDGYADSTQAMYDAANEPRQLQLYPGGGHGVALFARHPDLIDLVVNFIRGHGGA